MEKSRKKICLNDSTVGEELTNDNQTIEILNDDCLLHIFEYLPICDRIRLERVNKRWRALSRISWKSFRTLTFKNRAWGFNNQAKITRKILRKVLYLCGRFLKVLDMSATPVLADEIDMSYLLKFCKNLISVDFTSIIVGVPLIKSLVKNCKDIVVLKIWPTTCCVSGRLINDTILSTYTNLQVLSITSHYFLGDWVDLKNNSFIKELHLESCLWLNIRNLAATAPQLQNLHTLSLQGSLKMSNYPDNLDFIKLSNIKTLNISNNWQFVDDEFLQKTPSAFARLTNLMIGGNHKVTDVGLSAVISPSNLENLNIDELNIEGSSLTNLPYLKRLSCRYCQRLNDKGLESLFITSDRLESIDLKGVNDVERIIKRAIKGVKSRKNHITLSMLVNKIDVDITDVLDNLKLFMFEKNEDISFNSFKCIFPCQRSSKRSSKYCCD